MISRGDGACRHGSAAQVAVQGFGAAAQGREG
jgi:hypothetical protein